MSRINSIPFDMISSGKDEVLYKAIADFIMEFFGVSGIAIRLPNKEDDTLLRVSSTPNFESIRDLAEVLPVMNSVYKRTDAS